MQDFRCFCEDFFKRYFKFNPSEAIAYGVMGHEAEWEDYSDDRYAEERAFYSNSLTALLKFSPKKLTRDEKIDKELMRGMCTVKAAEFARGDYRIEKPNLYIPFDAIYYLTKYPNSDPAGFILERLEGVSYFMMQGVEEFHIREAHPPRLWVKMAISELGEGIGFLDSLAEMPGVAEGIKDPERFGRAVEQAKSAVRHFRHFLEHKVLAQVRDSYAVGEEHFNLLLRHKHFLPMNARQLLALGERLFAETKKELLALTEKIAPGKSIDEAARMIQECHPAAKELIPAYQDAVQRARDFVQVKGLVTFPPQERLEVIETPVFKRNQIPFAAYLSPSPNDPNQVGYYYVTPAKNEDELREHNYRGLENTSAHEAYPGHHLQLTLANYYPAAHTLARLINGSSVMFEGWALYCEQMMHDQGFLGSPEHEFLMLKDRLWRTMRIIIDVKTQCGLMSYDEAANWMMQELAFPRSQAEADLNWYSQAPATPMGYALGWSMITNLRKREEVRLGKRFSLRKFHDKFLQAGSIAPPLIIKRYFRK
ncbi:MAG: DUF885 domain-containing protein [Candidatus Sungbacteria bacterium]|nr:DUF885 domain-containing protein [Candidatus Sungbacteria bacterium]